MNRRTWLKTTGALLGAAMTNSRASATSELCFESATSLARRVRDRDVSARELLDLHLTQIEAVNPKVNAICTLAIEKARAAATEADRTLASGEPPGPLHGLPIAVKDLTLTKGIRTTFGSPIFKDFVPDVNALHVERLKAAGAIIIGKTNVPEFGTGSQTFNTIFGPTLNPYDPSKTCGGSSGGAAVALATGMTPLADGADLGGSLRNPASFSNVVGFRPSPGRVPEVPSVLPWQSLAVLGPMGRTVEDVALQLSVIAGADRRAPLSIEEPASVFASPLAREHKGTRIAWSANLGHLPMDPAVVDVCERSLSAFRDIGCELEEAHPDFEGAHDAFQTLRAWGYAHRFEEDMRERRHLLKDTVIWNAELGQKLSGIDVARAEAHRGVLFERMTRFFETYDFLVLPVSQVPPFPVEVEWVKQIGDTKMETYVDWMMSCCYITLTSSPAISVPCGFTQSGLPIGLQIVGPHRHERAVLELAHAFEQANGAGRNRPQLAV